MQFDKRGAQGARRGLSCAVRCRSGRFTASSTGLATVFLALSLCSAGQPAWAQSDWVPELAPNGSETRGRSDPIVILLPAGLDPAVYGNLAVELDDLDVTAFVLAEAGRLTVTPPEALGTGSHSLRLIERGADGSILERGFWSLEVRHSDLIRDLSLTADLAGEVNGRVADGGLTTPSQHVTGESAGNLEAAASDEGWRISAQGNYLYNSQLELGLDERNFDLGENRIDGDYEQDS
ncbi:hypothetical protein, partial [uncultured Nitratireductor sp.]|uniref:hypothetical protein n=1 Tax=uncultured Nitratireductor sp. TaxID=520953 RepID=UPI0025F8E794